MEAAPPTRYQGDRTMGRKSTLQRRKSRNYDYDVSLSFAGEDRKYVEQVASKLREHGVRVFYDEYERASLWGKDLFEHFDDIYQNAARYCILFISKHYANKVWTNHERASAQARAIREHSEYILPARFDNTVIPGVRDTIGFIDLRKVKPSSLASMIIEKLGDEPRENYFPPLPDLLFKRLDLSSVRSRRIAQDRAFHFFEALRRMTRKERRTLAQFLIHTCPEGLPENFHIDLDLLRRITGSSIPRLIRQFKGLSALGFSTRTRRRQANTGGTLVMEWWDGSSDPGAFGNATHVVNAVVAELGTNFCEECLIKAFEDLNFSQLSSTTALAHTALHTNAKKATGERAQANPKGEREKTPRGNGHK